MAVNDLFLTEDVTGTVWASPDLWQQSSQMRFQIIFQKVRSILKGSFANSFFILLNLNTYHMILFICISKVFQLIFPVAKSSTSLPCPMHLNADGLNLQLRNRSVHCFEIWQVANLSSGLRGTFSLGIIGLSKFRSCAECVGQIGKPGILVACYSWKQWLLTMLLSITLVTKV